MKTDDIETSWVWSRLDKKSSAEAYLGFFVADLDKELAWQTGMTFKGLTISLRENGWLMTVRASQDGSNYVLFCAGLTMTECYRELWWSLKQKTNHWRPDKFNPKG